MQVLAGVLLFAAGIAGMLRLVPEFVEITYPLAWWGLLMLVDAWNRRHSGLSLWMSPRRFWAVTLPVSALLWIGFELLNLPSPEWIYIGGFHSIAGQTVLGCVAFSTVVPILVEAWWLVRGSDICFTTELLNIAERWRAVFVAAGVITLVLPWINHIWWINQAMWLAPALLLLPFLKPQPCGDSRRWLGQLALAGLLAGIFWEGLNYPSHTHWQYQILPHAPHLFEMPLPGYIGFIPFALTCLAVYQGCRRIPATAVTAVLLYALAGASMLAVTRIYFERGIWRPS